MKKWIVIFDFGHGTREYMKGKHSARYTMVNGKKVYALYEGEWSREVGGRIVDYLRLLGVDCRTIINEPDDVSLSERCARVNKIVADNKDANCILISIHIDAAGLGDREYDARGTSVRVGVKDKKLQSSKVLAQDIYSFVKPLGLQGNRSVPAQHYWVQDLKILNGTNCPSVLTENLFMDNPDDLDILLSEEGKEKIINMHIAGICKHIGVPCGLSIA